MSEPDQAPPTKILDDNHWVGCKECGGYGVERCHTCGKIDPECECKDNPWNDCPFCGGTSLVWVGKTN